MSDLTQQEAEFFESGGETAVDAPEAEAVIEQPSEAPAEPEQVEQEPAAQEQEQPREAQRMVQIDALLEARAQAKELKAQLARMAEERKQFDAWRQQVEQRLSPQQQVPDFDENPAENLRAQVTATKAELEAMKRQAQEHAVEANFNTWFSAQEQTYAQQQPDYYDAANALLSARHQELAQMGLDEAAAREQVRKEVKLASVSAAQMGINPADWMYQAALRKGYTPKQGKNAEQLRQDSSQKIQAVSDGIKSSRTVSNVAGKATGGLTIEYILSLPDAEQKKYLDNWDETHAKLG